MFEGKPASIAQESYPPQGGLESSKLPRQTREEFISRQFAAGEINSTADLYNEVVPWLASILNSEGVVGVDQLLKEIFDQIDFTKDPEAVAVDLNKSITKLLAVMEEVDAPPVILPEPVLENNLANTLPSETALKPLILNETMRVAEPDVMERQNPLVLAQKSLDSLLPETSFKSRVESLSSQPSFNHDAFLELLSDISRDSESRYNAVVDKARANLNRFDGVYAPGTAEKRALQFLSSIQGQSARMGVIRAEVVNSLERTDQDIEPDLIKKLAIQYADSSDKLMNNVHRLEELIEEASKEDTPLFSENYRQELDFIYKEAKSVLKNISPSHSLYNEFKEIVESDLGELRNFFEQTKLNNYQLVDSLDPYIARRDKIKAAVAYMKAEHDYQAYLAALTPKISQFLTELETVDLHTKEAENTKLALVNNINDLLSVVLDNSVFVTNLSMGAGGLQSISDLLSRRHEKIKNEFGGIKEVYSTLVSSESNILPEVEEVTPSQKYLKFTTVGSSAQVEGPSKPLLILEKIDYRLQVAKTELADTGLALRHRNIMKRLPKTSFSKVAALISAILFTPTPNVESSTHTAGALSVGMLTQSTPTVANYEAVAIEMYLRQFQQPATVEKKEEVTPWNISSKLTPSFAEVDQNISLREEVKETVPTEILPGVIFPEIKSSNIRPEPPSLKIFSAKADNVKSESLEFNADESEKNPDNKLNPYTIKIGDNFWDINEGETLAGKLPVMNQINPYFKNALIDLARDEINRNPVLKEGIGGFGDTANDLIPDRVINLQRLNDLLTEIAVNQGYLQ